jgi:sugar-specific transcriptional regulator TrmB
VDDVVSRLTACGLGEKEARAFANLTHLGQSKVTDVASAAGLKRAETYQVLERLQSRGLVEGTLSRPRQFTAVAAERAVQILVEEREQTLKAVQSMQDDLTQRLRKLGGGASEPTPESFRVLHDRNQIVGQLTRTLRAAQQELAVVASSRSLFRLLLDEGLEGEFQAASKRGVEIRVLTEILPGQEEVLARLAEFADVRHLMVPRPLRFFIGDEREIVQYVTADPMGGAAKETAMWLGARDHVQAQRAFFDDLWGSAMRAPARLEELQTGRAPEQVQVVQGRFTRYEKEKEILLRAREEIALILPKEEAGRLGASGVQRVLAARIAEGLQVRVLVPPGTLLQLPGAQVRQGDMGKVLPRVVADRAEALLVLPGRGSSEKGVTGTEECAVWITLAPSVESLSDGFERRWAAAKET